MSFGTIWRVRMIAIPNFFQLPQFLFSDSATVIVSLLADPHNERGFGRGEVNATTPYRVLCLQNYRNEPTENPDTPQTIVSCGPVDYIMYVVNSQGRTGFILVFMVG